MAILLAYAALIALGSWLLKDSTSFSVPFWYMGLLAPFVCLYVASGYCESSKYPDDTSSLALFALTGFVALSAINLLMGYVSTTQGSVLGWKPTAALAGDGLDLLEIWSGMHPSV